MPPGTLQGTDWEEALEMVATALEMDEGARKLLQWVVMRGCQKEAKQAIEVRIQAGVLTAKGEDGFLLHMNRYLED